MTGRIVHLGVGNFHRAHQAWYTQRANETAGEGWRITGVSLRRPDVRDALRAQNYAYTLEIDDGSGPAYTTITVIDRILVAPEDPGAVIAAIADPATAIVTLTVTEKGYTLDPATWRLRADHPDVRADLEASLPATAVGMLVAGLAARLDAGAGGLTVLCCDNLPENGKVLRRAALDFAQMKSATLAGRIEANFSFPSSMVDRITPATTDELRARVAAMIGRKDAAPVATEGFSQWVIEDDFHGRRPAWETVGVELVSDVRPHELRKLRMLNGAHSTLAYAGTLASHAYVHEAVADPKLRALARGVMDEAAGTLPESVRATAPAYADGLIRRFENPGLHHALIQIAMDGSQKIPVRLLAPLKDRLRAGLPSPSMEAGIAAWAAFVWRQTRDGVALNDPLADALAGASRGRDRESAADSLLQLEAVFGTFARDFPESVERIRTAYR